MTCKRVAFIAKEETGGLGYYEICTAGRIFPAMPVVSATGISKQFRRKVLSCLYFSYI